MGVKNLYIRKKKGRFNLRGIVRNGGIVLYDPRITKQVTPEPTETKNQNDMKNKFLSKTGKVLKGIAGGLVDTFLPNINKSIKMSESDLPNDPKKKIDIDVPRLITAVTVWIILILVFFGKIKFEDVIELIDKLL